MKPLRYLSICSGIEAASVAWHPLGWQPVAFAEIELFPSAVLGHHYPDVPNWGDVTKFQEWPDATFDVLVGGTPCQSFSVAGLRKGMADPRGNLALTYLAIADRYRPEWVVWENVPGVLSSGGGRDFGSFIGGLGQLGYHAAWRVLDAQYVRVDGFERGVPQRRRRVFVVGHSRDWRRAASVLFERESLCWDTPPRRAKGERIAGPIAGCSNGGGANGPGRSADDADTLITSHDPAVTLCGRDYKGPLPEADLSTVVAHALRADSFNVGEDGTGRGTPIIPIYTLAVRGRGDGHDLEYRTDETANAVLTPNGGRAGIGVGAVAFAENQRAETYESDTIRSLTKGGGKPGQGYPAIRQGYAVRRLTPTECERLQGFPDNYTLVPWRGKSAADGPRYKALGNSMAVNCMRWIGERIDLVRGIDQ